MALAKTTSKKKAAPKSGGKTQKAVSKKASSKTTGVKKPRTAKPKASAPLTHEQNYKELKACLSQLRKTANDEQKTVLTKAGKLLNNLYVETCVSRDLLNSIASFISPRI